LSRKIVLHTWIFMPPGGRQEVANLKKNFIIGLLDHLLYAGVK
jgi:hypothetical protein